MLGLDGDLGTADQTKSARIQESVTRRCRPGYVCWRHTLAGTEQGTCLTSQITGGMQNWNDIPSLGGDSRGAMPTIPYLAEHP